ncbi:MAG: amino acid racemase [Kangiellaceae bacterium]|nr:amino acid racemase [Kangiellaceae bacterium]MCW9017878.1 amino acid racemase [Kangiellaceae bacterium]
MDKQNQSCIDSLKHIGIVGCSAEGATLCYKTICLEAEKYLGQYVHPQVSMHTHSLANYVDCLDNNDLSGIAELMLSSADKLKAAGADFLICPDNTIHQAFRLVEDNSPLPWLHIADGVIENARQNHLTKLGILGTDWLVNSNVYPDKLDQAGLGWIRPKVSQIETIGRLIMQELVRNQFKPETIDYFLTVVSDLKSQGCDGIILGCTEIPLIINDQNAGIKTLDSNKLLAEAALMRAINHE